ncbi:MAG: hypothetical protein I3273_08040, partial [Candidatus Moeniiplasma glomeromycotorum]|nr:hypothetical protein [Candidatus Moeniiplasma glomeromycotorum]
MVNNQIINKEQKNDIKNNLKVFALGGLNEVGKNCYILEKNNDIIIVDCGVK